MHCTTTFSYKPVHVLLNLQTVNDFREEYFRIYANGTTTDPVENEDDNLVVRSFTDDPEIPLRQIRVSEHLNMTLIDDPYMSPWWLGAPQAIAGYTL